MILIADGGSTKTSWTLIQDGSLTKQFYTEGYNPYYASSEYITNSLKQALPDDLDPDAVLEIAFYGAGVHNAQKAGIVESAFKRIFNRCKVNIDHDLLAAARALLGNEPGFAAILGTGTNTCLYDGDQIIHHVDSCGYIIGDEGSGCHIGLKILKDYLRGAMPNNLLTAFHEKYQLTESEIMDHVYTEPFANRYAASFTRFAGENIHESYCQNLIKESFIQFFEQLVSVYPSYKSYSFNCIGSVGYSFREILSETAQSFGMQTGVIVSSPMDGLVEYHLKNLSK
ncbi:N-acetylglucosamine kinase [Pedobacter sp. HMF7647]|uniref:N-acetylglucosamine kinase n=1 Tax=Hufsiella arboris TaxID=2695275 RepID=A0A7K1Y8N8_9SPHI|nr:N-acetylglucosamine kinase [Hufsiella arboris]MXV50946.1 N-acetylglucosamine kinase [Hufsiella arboris]